MFIPHSCRASYITCHALKKKVIHGKKKHQKGVIHELASAFSDSRPPSLCCSHFLAMRPRWRRRERSRDLKSTSHELLRDNKYHNFKIKHLYGMNISNVHMKKKQYICPQRQNSITLCQQCTLFSDVLYSFIALSLNSGWKIKIFFHFMTLITSGAITEIDCNASQTTWEALRLFGRTEVKELFFRKRDFAVPSATLYGKNSQNNVKVLTPSGRTGNPAAVNKTVTCLKSEFSDAANGSLGFKVKEKNRKEKKKIITENNSGGFQNPDISLGPAAVWGRRSGRLQTTSRSARNHISFDGVGWFTLNLAHAWRRPGPALFTFHYQAKAQTVTRGPLQPLWLRSHRGVEVRKRKNPGEVAVVWLCIGGRAQ